jgi:hypothetical protein
MNNKEKLEYIRSLNICLGLPQQEPDNTLLMVNSSPFQPLTVKVQLFHSILSHTLFQLITPQDEQFKLIREYGILIGEANKPKTVSVGVLNPKPNRLFVTLIIREVNNAGYWILVQRTIFLFQGHPEFLLNIVFMDKYFVPLKEGRRAKAAGQAPQNYVRASRISKKKFVQRSKLLCDRFLPKQIAPRSNLLSIAKQFV